jgi:hypothetical protein
MRKHRSKLFKKNMEWTYPSQYASLHEQSVKRGIKIATDSSMVSSNMNSFSLSNGKVLKKEKKIVLLINEGTASSAEIFASSLHDNGRLIAVVGAQTYGKGLIQHTFPTLDGGGLRLTVGKGGAVRIFLTLIKRHSTLSNLLCLFLFLYSRVSHSKIKARDKCRRCSFFSNGRSNRWRDQTGY